MSAVKLATSDFTLPAPVVALALPLVTKRQRWTGLMLQDVAPGGRVHDS
jgi:hypothetical protein